MYFAPIFYNSAAGTAYCLAVDFIFDNLNKANALKEAVKSLITGVALAIIHKQFGVGALYGAAAGLVLARAQRFVKSSEEANLARVLFIGLGAVAGRVISRMI